MKTENRQGVELEITDIEGGIQKLVVTNLPIPLTYYTDEQVRKLTESYTPGVVGNRANIGKATRVGCAFPEDQRDLEAIVFPLVSISYQMGEYGGTNHEGYATIVAWTNGVSNKRFQAVDNPPMRDLGIELEYLRTRDIEGQTVYFPTEKAVRAMCNKRHEDVMYNLALHTGVPMGIGHLKLPKWAGD